MSGKVSSEVCEEVSGGVSGAGFTSLQFAQPANARQPSNIRAVRGISMFPPQVPEVPESIPFSSTSRPSKKQFGSGTFDS